MCVWDMQGGRCVEHAKSSNVHVSFTGYYLPDTDDYRLVACGYYPGVQVINPMTLQVLFTLTAKISADWISALTIVKLPGQPGSFITPSNTTIITCIFYYFCKL
jgi:hypothetical protein